MKLSKSLMIAALALFAGGTALQAQNSTNPPANAPSARARNARSGQNIDQLAVTLKLDDATKIKVKAILDAQQKKIADLRANTTASTADRRTKTQAIRAEMTKQMRAVLTGEQFDQWQKTNQPRQRRAVPADGAPAAAAPVAPPAAAPQK
jgi:periplasmic protein CpxP/Spy